LAIEFLHVNKSFGTNHIIKDFSFNIDSGKITYMLGPNGCGKTTLINLMLGLLENNSGSILYDGKPIAAVRDRIAIVFDEPPVYPNLSGYDNLILLSQRMKRDSKDDSLFKILNLDKRLLGKKAKTLSLGQRHRLAIAAAILREPSYLILDEPAIGLDSESWDCVKGLLIELGQQGKTVMVTGHNYDLMENFVDNIIIISNAAVIYNDTLSNLKKGFKSEVVIKTSCDKIEEYGFEKTSVNEFSKNYINDADFESELIQMQKKGIIIENVTTKRKNLKEMYVDLIK